MDTSKIIDISGKVSQSLYNAETEQNNNVVGLRIREARKLAKMSSTVFAESLRRFGVDITRQMVSKWERGISVPNAYQLIAMTHVLGITDGLAYFTSSRKQAVKAPPVLSSEGLAKLEEYRQLLIASKMYEPVSETSETKTELIEMSVSVLRASAGPGSYLDEGLFEKVLVDKGQVPDKAEYGIKVNGNSMEPVFHDGQTIWIQTCSTLEPGDVGIFEYDGNGYVKQYTEQEPDERDREYYLGSDGVMRRQPVLVSFNKDYAPIRVSPAVDFRIVGKVLY